MSDQSKLGLGAPITTHQNKDAIHIAVAPIMAAHTLIAGRHVGIDKLGRATEHEGEPIGIVDPFLKVTIEPGQRFWLFLYPGTITSMHHQWSHPSFQDGEQITRAVNSASEKWLREFAASVDANYDEMMEVAATHCEGAESSYGEYLIQGGKWEGQSTPAEFWTHFSALTGKTPKSEYGMPGIFSCSC